MESNVRYNTNGLRTEQEAQVRCPYCGSSNTEFFSLFGKQLLTVQYYCNACHTPFERIKDDDVLNSYNTEATRKDN